MTSALPQLADLLAAPAPLLALAPMHDITDLGFWQLVHRYGTADLYFTEYIRVHGSSKPQRDIVRAITANPTGRPVIAQLIGNDPHALARTARELETYPIAGIDLNLGCPAPIVYRKAAGGGLLRDLQRIDLLLGTLRDAVRGSFSVKTRLGFASAAELDALLPIFAKHALDLLTVHGRTVHEQYHSPVHYDRIADAVAAMPCPVLANGDVTSARSAAEVLALTGARGLMIGRAAIRNPWIFAQIRAQRAGVSPPAPTGYAVLDYVRALFDSTVQPETPELKQVQMIKRSMNYLGVALDDGGAFLHAIQRVQTRAEFFGVCEASLGHDRPLTLEPPRG